MISTLVLCLANAYLTVADVNALSEEDYALKRQFRLKGTVVSKSGCGCIFFRDKTGRTVLANVAHNSVRLGDTIDIGLIARNNKVGHHSLVSTGQKVIGHEDLGAPPAQPLRKSSSASSTIAMPSSKDLSQRRLRTKSTPSVDSSS